MVPSCRGRIQGSSLTSCDGGCSPSRDRRLVVEVVVRCRGCEGQWQGQTQLGYWALTLMCGVALARRRARKTKKGERRDKRVNGWIWNIRWWIIGQKRWLLKININQLKRKYDKLYFLIYDRLEHWVVMLLLWNLIAACWIELNVLSPSTVQIFSSWIWCCWTATKVHHHWWRCLSSLGGDKSPAVSSSPHRSR